MNFYIIIPAYNEEAHLQKTLHSLISQTLLPKKLMVVNDNSTDDTQKIIDSFKKEHSFITSITTSSEKKHQPGSKVIEAFYQGLQHLDNNYDVICKFDADLIFPKNYLEAVANTFQQNPKCGMAGGFCYIEKNGTWVLENLTNKDHIRGALKAYKKECFQQMDGLKRAMGWDTLDELLAQFHGWKIMTDENLQVKHLKPTGHSYRSQAGKKQGRAFKQMRYGLWLSLIASAKLALKKKSPSYFVHSIRGYINSKPEYLVSKEEGVFIRKHRWKGIKRKLI